MGEVKSLTVDQNFANAFRYAASQGAFILRMDNFKGWDDDCNCAHCRSQRIIFEFFQAIKKESANES